MIRRQVTIQQLPGTVDDFGAPGDMWQDLFTLGATIVALSAQERVSVNREIDASVYQFTFPKGSESIQLTTDHRIVFGSRVFNITSVEEPSLRGREVVVMAESVT